MLPIYVTHHELRPVTAKAYTLIGADSTAEATGNLAPAPFKVIGNKIY